MARTVGPDQICLTLGDAALRKNDLPDAISTYIIGTRNDSEASALSYQRLGLALVARVDEEISYAARAPDMFSEAHAVKNALICSR